jgi:ATP-dependent Lhr-like helicase
MPSAVDILRSLRAELQTPEVLFLAATDPANPYGTLLPWPHKELDESRNAESGSTVEANTANSLSLPSMSRTRGACVILINGSLAAFFRRQNPAVRVFLPQPEPEQTQYARELGKKFAEIAIRQQGRKTGLLIGSINDTPAREHFLARFLEDAGFVNTALGFQMRRVTPISMRSDETDEAPRDPWNDNDADEIESGTVGKT